MTRRIVVLFAIFAVACAELTPAKTPAGVDARPILGVQLESDIAELDRFEKLVPKDAVHERNARVESLRFLSPHGRGREGVFRSIEISRHDGPDSALLKYRSYKQEFTSSGWELFEEKGRAGNRYFLSHRRPWMDKNHGIPVGVVDHPEILLASQKRNLLIVVSYTSHQDGVDHVREINEDVAWVASVLSKSRSPR